MQPHTFDLWAAQWDEQTCEHDFYPLQFKEIHFVNTIFLIGIYENVYTFYIRIKVKKDLIPLVSCFVAYLRMYVADDDFLRRPNLKIRSLAVFCTFNPK